MLPCCGVTATISLDPGVVGGPSGYRHRAGMPYQGVCRSPCARRLAVMYRVPYPCTPPQGSLSMGQCVQPAADARRHGLDTGFNLVPQMDTGMCGRAINVGEAAAPLVNAMAAVR